MNRAPTVQAAGDEPTMFNGLTEAETDATASVMGLVHSAVSTSSVPTAAPLLSSQESNRSELPRGPSVKVLIAKVEHYGRSCAVDAYKSAEDRLAAVSAYAEEMLRHAYAEGRKDQAEESA